MDKGADDASPAAASPWLRRVLADLAWLFGLGFLGLFLCERLPYRTFGIIWDIVSSLGFVLGFALAGIRAGPGQMGWRVLRLWAVLALAFIVLGGVWFLWIIAKIHHPISEFWAEALDFSLYPALTVPAFMAVAAATGWLVACLVRHWPGPRPAVPSAGGQVAAVGEDAQDSAAAPGVHRRMVDLLVVFGCLIAGLLGGLPDLALPAILTSLGFGWVGLRAGKGELLRRIGFVWLCLSLAFVGLLVIALLVRGTGVGGLPLHSWRDGLIGILLPFGLLLVPALGGAACAWLYRRLRAPSS